MNGAKRKMLIGRSLRQGLVVALLAAGLTGCTTISTRSDGGDEERALTQIESDPILIRAIRDGDEIRTEHLDAEEVFQRAFHDFQARRYEDALENYLIIINYFDESRFHLPSLYNGGLCLENIDEWRDAVILYRELIARYPESSEALNAYFRLANALHELEEYDEVVELLTEVLLRRDLEHFDRVEAHVRRGNALLELEQWSDAENSFQNVLEINRRASNRERLGDENRFILQTHFGLGKAIHARMNDIPLVLPPERMAEDLETKIDHHLLAQRYYIQALRQHHPYWSVAAGFMIGRLYQDFYMDIFTAEIPDGLTDQELAAYFQELRRKIQRLMDRALNIYERNLSLSRRVVPHPETEVWVAETTLHMSRMRAFLEDPLVQKRAERLVISGGNLEDLWDPSYYAAHHVLEAVGAATKAATPEEEETTRPSAMRGPERRGE